MTSTQFAALDRKLLLAVSLEPREIGQRIRAARERQGWTQLTFALEADVSPSTVARWEAGGLPPIRELVRVATVLEIPAEQLVEPAAEVVSDPAGLEALAERVEEVLAQVHELRALVEPLVAALRQANGDIPPAPPARQASRRSRSPQEPRA